MGYPFTNDEIFKVVMQDESIARKIIGIVLGREVREIKNYTTQKDKKVRKLARGVRFDLYFEDDETAYEVEMQNSICIDVGRRCRFYQSMIDVDLLAEGEDFGNLKDSYIIFLCTYDPFGKDVPVYAFETVCTNEPANVAVQDALKLDTGAKLVFCNACAYEKSSDDLRDFLSYLSTRKVAKNNAFIERIDEAVRIANANEEVRGEAMISEYKIRDAAAASAAEAAKRTRIQENDRVIRLLERNSVGISPSHLQKLIEEVQLKKG